MTQARERLEDAQRISGMVHPAVLVSAAYYSMLNAARAALSERGEYAKTHGGTWTLFSKVFVATGEFDRELSGLAGRVKEARERGDYDAAPPSPEEAADFLSGAADFLAAIERLLGVEE
jgi:uncharacterized protein (UPF0332 family)